MNVNEYQEHLNYYEYTEQLLVDLLDYYEVNEMAANEAGSLLSAVDYHDKAISLRAALNLVVSHHQYEYGCQVVLPVCSRLQHEEEQD